MLLDFFYETIWLHHIDDLIKIAIQECNLDIHFPYLIIEICYNR